MSAIVILESTVFDQFVGLENLCDGIADQMEAIVNGFLDGGSSAISIGADVGEGIDCTFELLRILKLLVYCIPGLRILWKLQA